MITSELTITTTVWLQEGLRLREILVRLAGAALLESYIEARRAFRSLPWRRPGSTAPITAEEWRRSARHDELHLACVTPLVDALNSGRVIAVRGDYNTSQFVRLLPPATGWRFHIFDLDKSLIFHPRNLAQSLFVLFMFADREPAVALEPATIVVPIGTTDQRRQSSRSSGKAWLASAVQRIPPDDRKHGWRRRYAKKLAAIMAEEARTDKNLKPLRWTSIVARLSEHSLWPNA
jgi:hypothetical protein